MIATLKYSIFLLTLSVFSFQMDPKISDATRHKMVNFLVEQQQFAKTDDPWSSYKDYIHARTIFERKVGKGFSRIYLFGENSDHGKTYIALSNDKDIVFLLTQDLGKDMDRITGFIKSSTTTIGSGQIAQLFNTIAQCYIDNERTYMPQLKK